MSRSSREAGAYEASILLIEPGKVLCDVVESACSRRGWRVHRAEGVGGAISSFMHLHPLAVLSAVELPGLGGASLVAALKSSPYHRAIPIALMTSDKQCREHVGVLQPDAVICKDSTFSESLEQFLDSVRKEESGDDDSSDTGLNARILLAEDSASVQLFVGRMLHQAGADVVIANTGWQAVELFHSGSFDLVLMDIEMPEMDGREAVQILRGRGVSVPILALTGHDTEEFQSEALDLGFDEVLGKPISAEDMIEACRKAIYAEV